jgi:hypothetical protein
LAQLLTMGESKGKSKGHSRKRSKGEGSNTNTNTNTESRCGVRAGRSIKFYEITDSEQTYLPANATSFESQVGDRIIMQNDIFVDADGADANLAGDYTAICTILTVSAIEGFLLYCDAQIVFDDVSVCSGTLNAGGRYYAGFDDDSMDNIALTITGGTGAWISARGSIAITEEDAVVAAWTVALA